MECIVAQWVKYGNTQYILNSYPDLMEHEIGLNSTQM